MSVKEFVKPFIPDHLWKITREFANKILQRFDLASLSFSENESVSDDIYRKYKYKGDIVDFFAGNTSGVVHKWHHYIPLYDRYFANFRGRNIRFLEIGVSKGGSLEMWRKYFGPDAIIYGIDIDPTCRKFDGIAGQVRIGSQDDPAFLQSVIAEMGGVDIVLDDGSHHMKHIPVSLEFLFGHLNDGGIYMIEDLHTAYWREYGGGYRARGNFFNYVMDLVDDIHRWYHGRKLIHPTVSGNCTGIHIHDSLVVLEKGTVYQPVHSRIGA